MTTRKDVDRAIMFAKNTYNLAETGLIISYLREYKNSLPPDKEPWLISFEAYKNINNAMQKGTGPEDTFRDGFFAGQIYERNQDK